MKQKILMIMAALMLSACAGQATNWGDRSESEIASWRKAGVVFEDVDKYVKEKMTARDVLVWKNTGFTAAENIIAWKRGKFTASEAKEWKDKGFGVIEAGKWKDNEFTLKDAASWKNADFTLETAKKDRAQGLIPNP